MNVRQLLGTTVTPFLLFSLLFGSANAHEPPSGLLAHFTFDGTFDDATGNGFTAEVLAREGDAPVAPALVEGRFGRAVEFDGDYALIIPLDLHYELYPQVTITGWMYLEEEDARGALIGTSSGDGPRLQVINDDLFATHSEGRNRANNALRAGRWMFFAGSWDYETGTMRLSWRARSQTEMFDVDELAPPGQEVYIGALNDALTQAAADVRVDDIRIYGRYLSDDELVGLRLGPPDERISGPARPDVSGAGPQVDPSQADVELPSSQDERTLTPTEAAALAEGAVPEGVTEEASALVASQLEPSEALRAQQEYERRRDALLDAASDSDSGTVSPETVDLPRPGAGTSDGPTLTGSETNTDYEDLGAADPNLFALDESELDRIRLTVVFDGSAGSGRTGYTFVAGGLVEKASGDVDGFEASVNEEDTIRDRTVTGAVGTGVDAYYVYGSVESVSLDDPQAADVYVDGELVSFDASGTDLRTARQGLEPEDGESAESTSATGRARGAGTLTVSPGDSDDPGLAIVAGAASETAFSGDDRYVEDIISLDLVDYALHSIEWYEERDRPCEIEIAGYAPGLEPYPTARKRLERCDGDGGSQASRKTVSLHGDRAAVRSLRVCQSSITTDRLKGIELDGNVISQNNVLTRDTASASVERANCADWGNRVGCPAGEVATGVRVGFANVRVGLRSRNPPYTMISLKLLCREAVD